MDYANSNIVNFHDSQCKYSSWKRWEHNVSSASKFISTQATFPLVILSFYRQLMGLCMVFEMTGRKQGKLELCNKLSHATSCDSFQGKNCSYCHSHVAEISRKKPANQSDFQNWCSRFSCTPRNLTHYYPQPDQFCVCFTRCTFFQIAQLTTQSQNLWKTKL